LAYDKAHKNTIFLKEFLKAQTYSKKKKIINPTKRKLSKVINTSAQRLVFQKT